MIQAKQVNGEIWIISALQHSSGIAKMEITSVSDQAAFDAPAELPVRHFVLNRTWNSTDEPAGIKFIRSVPDLGRDWVMVELLPIRRK